MISIHTLLGPLVVSEELSPIQVYQIYQPTKPIPPVMRTSPHFRCGNLEDSVSEGVAKANGQSYLIPILFRNSYCLPAGLSEETPIGDILSAKEFVPRIKCGI